MGVSKVTLNGTTLIDVTDKTVDTDNLIAGNTALRNDGESITGAVVTAPASTSNPIVDGTATPGVSDTYSRGDHVHPTDTSRASATHTHGDITNSGDITNTATIASGDRLVINDESASKITNSSITFGTSETTYLTNKGTWATPTGTYSLPTASADELGGIKVGTNLSISNGVLSATDTTYTAGTGIDITNGVISNTQTSAEWGNITGTLSDQTDLNTALGNKQDTLTFDGTYNASTNKAATVSTVTNAINALDGGTIGTGSTTKTITSLSQTNGNVSATFSDIAFPVTSVNTKTGAVSLTASDVSALPDSTDVTRWNGVSLNTSGYSNTGSDLYIPAVTGTSSTGANYYMAKSTPSANVIAKYDVNEMLKSTTPTAGDSSTKVATTAFVGTAISNITYPVTSVNTKTGAVVLTASDVDALPETGGEVSSFELTNEYTYGEPDLTTETGSIILEDGSVMLKSDADYPGNTSSTSSISITPPQVSLSFEDETGSINNYISVGENGTFISGLVDPSNNTDAANKLYVDTAITNNSWFMAYYDTTTYQEIYNVWRYSNTYTKIVVDYNGVLYLFDTWNNTTNTFYFSNTNGNRISTVICNNTNGWSNSYVDLVTETRTINNKALSSDITLTASDVGAQSTISVSGILKGGGSGNISAAVAGTDYQAPLPSQSGNNGKFLTTNGSALSWGEVDALPSQTGQSGKFLTTNGTNASWATVDLTNYMVKGVDYVTAGQKSGFTIGTKATAEGYNNNATGNYSHAEGSNTTASGSNSHAEGDGTQASNDGAHAEGDGTIASGINSHAEGEGSVASGRTSHAEGNTAGATGDYSHAEGSNTIAQRRNQHVFGRYNILDTTGSGVTVDGAYVEIVGNGTASNARSNARTLDWSGNETLAGSITIGNSATMVYNSTTNSIDFTFN